MTQLEVAEKIGVAPATWSKWERGKRYPDIGDLKKIETLFGVSYNDIIFLDRYAI